MSMRTQIGAIMWTGNRLRSDGVVSVSVMGSVVVELVVEAEPQLAPSPCIAANEAYRVSATCETSTILVSIIFEISIPLTITFKMTAIIGPFLY